MAGVLRQGTRYVCGGGCGGGTLLLRSHGTVSPQFLTTAWLPFSDSVPVNQLEQTTV
jgi:hypothetical protein